VARASGGGGGGEILIFRFNIEPDYFQ
jgi:hypothetical protein